MAKYVLRTKIHQVYSRTLLQAQKGKSVHQKHLFLSRWPCQHAPGTTLTAQTFNMSATIQKVEALNANQFICVHWEDGSESLYPAVWLRDNCQCPSCFLHSAKARKLPLEDLDVNIGAKNATLNEKKKVTFH